MFQCSQVDHDEWTITHKLTTFMSTVMYLAVSLLIVFVISPSSTQSLRFRVTQVQRDARNIDAAIRRTINRIRKEVPTIKENEVIAYHNQRFSICKVVRIIGKNHLNLVARNGHLKGVSSTDVIEGEGLFQMEVYGVNIIRLRDTKTQQYLIMSNKGHVKFIDEKNEQSLFFLHHEENQYITFASAKYYQTRKHDLFISVKRNGKVRLARNTEPGQTSSQFLPVGEGLCRD